MAMVIGKVTFTLDEDTIHRLVDAAERLGKPKSQIVREAVADYHNRIGRLSESERQRLLKTFDTLVPLIPTRPQTEVDRELREVREARRSGGRVSSSNKHK
jgi:predicted DNA-binding protein